MFAWKNNREGFLVTFSFFLTPAEDLWYLEKKKKGKLLGLECKTTGLFKKVFIFLQSLFFFQWEPRHSLTLASAGSWEQRGRCVYGRGLLTGEQRAQVEWGSHSQVFLRVAHVAAGRLV